MWGAHLAAMAPPATVGKRPSPPSPTSGRSHRRQTLEPPSDGAGAAGAGAGAAVSGTKESLESMHMQCSSRECIIMRVSEWESCSPPSRRGGPVIVPLRRIALQFICNSSQVVREWRPRVSRTGLSQSPHSQQWPLRGSLALQRSHTYAPQPCASITLPRPSRCRRRGRNGAA
jgi:hypothetical protein